MMLKLFNPPVSGGRLLAALLLAGLLAACDAAVPQPELGVARAKADQCVEPTGDMRRNHMQYLLTHRDETVIEGIRTTQHSLVECVNCHVAPVRADGSAVHYPDKDHFCASCHTYAGVKIDCFQCHADRPQVMDNPDYPHPLSANRYHQLASGGGTTVSLSDMLAVSGMGSGSTAGEVRP
ncbi:MAG: hypothetical protein KDI44_04600 [Thiothrix sp.]|nr:hypothetical protein [Thiothrix sp.]HPQ94865.1 hypothetical protein [Thiolinea sp.]